MIFCQHVPGYDTDNILRKWLGNHFQFTILQILVTLTADMFKCSIKCIPSGCKKEAGEKKNPYLLQKNILNIIWIFHSNMSVA